MLQKPNPPVYPARCGGAGTLGGAEAQGLAPFASQLFFFLNLRKLIAAFKTEVGVTRHPDLAVAADLEKFPAPVQRQAAVGAKFRLDCIAFLTVLTDMPQ